jgi:hypothetical protein
MRFGCRTLLVQSPLFGQVIEVSAGGMRLESSLELIVCRSYIFRLASGADFLNLPGRVTWCRLQRVEVTRRGSRRFYQLGIDLDLGESASRWRTAVADRAGVALGS